MTEPATGLATVQAVIAELAAIVASARATFGAERSGNQLEMAEMDLLSAQASIEKACMEIDLAPADAGDVLRFIRPALPGRVSDAGELSTAPRRVAPPRPTCTRTRTVRTVLAPCRSLDSLRLWRQRSA